MAYDGKREHERVEIQMSTRMWLDEEYNGKWIEFEGFAQTRDLSIGGVFIESTYLLPGGFPINLEMEIDDHTVLAARGEVANRVGHDDESPGMGIVFTEVDAENRERLLRFFVSDSVRDFYFGKFIVHFPHLESVLSLQDVALVLNLWEDKEERLTTLRHSTNAAPERPARGSLPSRP